MSDGRNIMTRAGEILSAAADSLPPGHWQWHPQGFRQYPQRITARDGTLIAECYENPPGGFVIAPYLALSGPEFAKPAAAMLLAKGEEYAETVEWIDGDLVHAAGCPDGGKRVLGTPISEGGCECFTHALEAAQALLDAIAYNRAGEWGR